MEILSRNDNRDELNLEGDSSGIGDTVPARLNGPRRTGNFEFCELGVRDDADRTGVGLLLAYGLGVVKLKGLKLCPVSLSDVLTEPFQRGRLSPRLDTDLGMRFPIGVADVLLAGVYVLGGLDSVDSRELNGFLAICDGGARVLREEEG